MWVATCSPGYGNMSKELWNYKIFSGSHNQNIMWAQLMDRCILSTIDSRNLVMHKVVYRRAVDDIVAAWTKKTMLSFIRKEVALKGRM